MADNNITLLLRAIVGSVQTLEDAFQQLLTERGVDTAVGAQLDVLGRIVGQERAGMLDDDYRRLVRARISVNRSKGTIADVISVADLIVDDVLASLVVDNQGMAALVLRVEDQPLTDAVAELLIPMLRNTVSAGVRIILEWSPQPVANWLVLDVDQLDDELMIGAVD
jgi:hypothetical protein